MSANLGESVRLGKRVCEEDSAVTLRASDGKMGDNQPVVAMSYDGYNQAGKEECCHTLGTCNSESPNNDKVVKVAIKQSFGINPSESGMMICTNPPKRECAQTLRRSPGGENGVLQMSHRNIDDIEAKFRVKINLRPAVTCSHRCEECRHGDFNCDDGGTFVWCRHPATLSLPDFFNIYEGDMVCNMFEPLGHKISRSRRESASLILQMKYIVRRLTPIECERLMGLPDGWTIPKNLEVTDALVEEFREKHDTFKRIMAEYENAPMPKPTSTAQVRKWLEKIVNPDTCPDAPRYKGCGNGWATNQPRWILLRLFAAEGIDPWWGEFDESKETKENNSDVSDN